MPEQPNIRRAERAAAALKRGEAVCLINEAQSLRFMAAEYWRHFPHKDAVGLVLAGPRAHYLSWVEDDSQAVVLPLCSAAEMEKLLFAKSLPKPAKLASAGALEQVALSLLKSAGAVPAAVLLKEEIEDELRVTRAEAEAHFRVNPRLLLLPPVRLPVEGVEECRAVGFDSCDGQTHLALLIGQPEKSDEPLVRLHSSCLTGDVLGSLRCDCGKQLKTAIALMIEEGNGVLLYLNQEGRGIGLSAKLRAYRLQEEGLDTVEANHALGFAEDERDFSLAAEMLKLLGIASIRLLTNNPAKLAFLKRSGIRVKERVPLHAASDAHNARYLATKKKRMGHLE